jgi:hypothetical protein
MKIDAFPILFVVRPVGSSLLSLLAKGKEKLLPFFSWQGRSPLPTAAAPVARSTLR